MFIFSVIVNRIFFSGPYFIFFTGRRMLRFSKKWKILDKKKLVKSQNLSPGQFLISSAQSCFRHFHGASILVFIKYPDPSRGIRIFNENQDGSSMEMTKTGLCRRDKKLSWRKVLRFDEFFFVQNFSFFRESQHSATSEKNKIWSRKKNSVNNNGKNEQLLVKTFFCKPIFKEGSCSKWP